MLCNHNMLCKGWREWNNSGVADLFSCQKPVKSLVYRDCTLYFHDTSFAIVTAHCHLKFINNSQVKTKEITTVKEVWIPGLTL